ncbi:MAG TPA: hypothetical protein VE998_12585, partial [Terriglobales bacterium]|nr:hypothetical protein [Terriglobales bacterium]
MAVFAFAALSGQFAGAQTTPAGTSPQPGPVTQLYLQLATAELDPGRVYRIREASLDRKSVEITFNDGKIAFTRDVDGRITGAFFEGDANLLISPPTDEERASLSLFTGAAILSDEFTSAYLRFDGDIFNELKPGLREVEDPAEKQEFYSHVAPIGRNLAENDAMRLLVSFADASSLAPRDKDQYLHLRVSGTSHGTYDVYLDPMNAEPVVVAQGTQVRDGAFLDVWTSFV